MTIIHRSYKIYDTALDTEALTEDVVGYTNAFKDTGLTPTQVTDLIPYNPSVSTGVERLIDSSSPLATQNPAGLGVANSLQLTFGPDQKTATDPVNLLSNGTVQINEAGLYRLQVSLQIGRVGAAGVAHIFVRALVNGTQAGRAVGVRLESASSVVYVENNAWVEFPAGAQVTYEIMRDLAGNDSGGLIELTPTVEAGSWTPSPSAYLRVERLVRK